MIREKVICNNCKFVKDRSTKQLHSWWECLEGVELRPKHINYQTGQSYDSNSYSKCCDKNYSGYCKAYERRPWWMFW